MLLNLNFALQDRTYHKPAWVAKTHRIKLNNYVKIKY